MSACLSMAVLAQRPVRNSSDFEVTKNLKTTVLLEKPIIMQLALTIVCYSSTLQRPEDSGRTNVRSSIAPVQLAPLHARLHIKFINIHNWYLTLSQRFTLRALFIGPEILQMICSMHYL